MELRGITVRHIRVTFVPQKKKEGVSKVGLGNFILSYLSHDARLVNFTGKILVHTGIQEIAADFLIESSDTRMLLQLWIFFILLEWKKKIFFYLT